MPLLDLLPIVAACILAGALAGFLAGLVGVGGGFTTIPILNYVLPLVPIPASHLMHVAVATSLAVMIVNTASAAWYRWRAGSLYPPLFALLAGPVALGALAGVLVADSVSDGLLRWGFILFVAVALARTLQTLYRPGPERELTQRGDGSLPSTAYWAPYFTVTGIAGAVAGGGAATLTTPFLLARRYGMQEAAGQSAALSAVIGLVGASTYAAAGQAPLDMPSLSLGYLYLPALAGLLIGGQFGVPQGLRLARRVGEARLRQIFFLLLAAVLLAMLAKQLGA